MSQPQDKKKINPPTSNPSSDEGTVALYGFSYAVPNGCPNNGGAPRTLLDGNLYMTDVSQKSRMRTFLKTVNPSLYFYHERGPITEE